MCHDGIGDVIETANDRLFAPLALMLSSRLVFDTVAFAAAKAQKRHAESDLVIQRI